VPGLGERPLKRERRPKDHQDKEMKAVQGIVLKDRIRAVEETPGISLKVGKMGRAGKQDPHKR